MSKESRKKEKKKLVVEMPIVNAYSAGIDVGDKEHVVAVAEGLCRERVRSFGSMSCDLEALASWLQECEVDTVAMESTGVYWKPLFSLLSSKGIEVYLVNAAHVRNVTGRKDDENDAMWIQKLHSCGLLNTSYLPDDNQEALRTIVRYRRTLLRDSTRFVNRIQKSLELMNIKFHTLIADIMGVSGQAVIQAIISGERNSQNFLPFIDRRVKASREAIIKSLEGNWRREHLFTLEESYQMVLTLRKHIEKCDKEIETHLQHYSARINEGEIIEAKEPDNKPQKPLRKDKNQPQFNIDSYLKEIYGVDVLAIYGISAIGGLEILAETGTDFSKWKDEKHFKSWLNLCPNNKISAGKIISSKLMKKHPNAASQAFRQAANAVQKSDHWLGDYFRRIKTKGGNKYAIVATAGKLAAIYYKMVRNKEEFKPINVDEYQQKYKKAKIAYLERKLSKLKEQLVA